MAVAIPVIIIIVYKESGIRTFLIHHNSGHHIYFANTFTHHGKKRSANFAVLAINAMRCYVNVFNYFHSLFFRITVKRAFCARIRNNIIQSTITYSIINDFTMSYIVVQWHWKI